MNKKAYVINETLEAMLKATASDSENKIVDDLLDGYDGESHEFSQKHKDDMQSIFRLERKMRIYSRAKTYAKRVAVIFIAIIALSTITIASVSAWRIKVINFILEMTQQDTHITIDQDGLKSNIYKHNEITFNYVPEGFMLEKSKSQNNYIYYEFTKEHEFFDFHTMDINSSLSIDTENANVKRIVINENEALYSENNNISILVWHDEELMYVLTGNISENELVKIAENIKIEK